MLISRIAKIAEDREKAKKITEQVQSKRVKGDGRTFKDILQDEIDKWKEEDYER